MNETEMKEKEALNSLERWSSAAEHCCSEARRKLEPFGLPEESVKKIMASLVASDYINDGRYAAAFTHDKVRFAKWGRVKIRYTLRQKQVPDDAISNALQEIDEDEYMESLEWAVRTNYRTQKGKTPYERSMKTLRSVAGRGFETFLIRDVLQQITGEDLDFQE